jgi:hypothetical protein
MQNDGRLVQDGDARLCPLTARRRVDARPHDPHPPYPQGLEAKVNAMKIWNEWYEEQT